MDNERGDGMTWAPIDTAPKPLKALKLDLRIVKPNGTSYRTIDAWWDDELGWVVATILGARMRAPRNSTHKITHWMPAPDKPGSK